MYEDKRTIMPNGLLSQATRQSSVTPNRVEVGFINQNATKPDSGHVNIDKAKAEAERKQKEAQDSGGMSVICTRYFLMGYMPLAIYELDSKYGQLIKEYHPEFYDWYLSWAQKLANQLHIRAWHNHVLVDLLWPFVDHWSREMANMMDESKKGSKLGAAIMFIGEYAFIAHQRIKQWLKS